MAQEMSNLTDDLTTSTASAPHPPGRRMIDVNMMALKYGCDQRSVFRWADTGRIPFGVKLGSLRRWDLEQVDAHLADGAPPVRRAKGVRS